MLMFDPYCTALITKNWWQLVWQILWRFTLPLQDVMDLFTMSAAFSTFLHPDTIRAQAASAQGWKEWEPPTIRCFLPGFLAGTLRVCWSSINGCAITEARSAPHPCWVHNNIYEFNALRLPFFSPIGLTHKTGSSILATVNVINLKRKQLSTQLLHVVDNLSPWICSRKSHKWNSGCFPQVSSVKIRDSDPPSSSQCDCGEDRTGAALRTIRPGTKELQSFYAWV